VRVFVALDIPQAVRDSLGQLRQRFEKLTPGARWVRLEGAHVTLKFIGEVSAAQVAQIRAELEKIPTRAPFELIFRGLGFFPNERHPRVFWAGIEGGADLAALAAAIETRLAPLGIPPESREFRPHLTLARFEPSAELGALRAAANEFAAGTDATGASAGEFGRVIAGEFHLYQSVLKPSGAEYTRLATYKFSAESA
jgi:2'-5' RNA ligase